MKYLFENLENEDTINVIEKSAMSGAGIKGASASQKLKNLNSHSGRNSVHVCIMCYIYFAEKDFSINLIIKDYYILLQLI